jgi:hypothetical protein
MFYLDPATQQRYYLGKPFSYNNVQYTRAGATHENFISLGFNQVLIQQRPDDRFYVVSGPASDGSYSSTPRDLDELKLNFIMAEKEGALSLLSASNWYVLRSEEGISIPAIYVDYRGAVRAASDLRCDQINGVATVEELEALMNAPAQVIDPAWDGQGDPVYIENPEPYLTEYPEPIDAAALVAANYGLPYEGA